MPGKTIASTQLKALRSEIEVDRVTGASEGGYNYVGIDALGRKIKGMVPFSTADEARGRLETSGITVESLKPVSSFWTWYQRRDARPSMKEMAQLAEQIGDQWEIGLAPDRICAELAKTHPNLSVKRALEDVAYRIRGGQPAHLAFEAQVDKKGNPLFPKTFVFAFRIGNDIGAIKDPVTGESRSALLVLLRFFALSQRRSSELLSKVRKAFIYPGVVMVFCVIAFFVEVFFVVPMFAQIFQGLFSGKNAELPFLTQLMLDISDFFRSYFGLFVTLLGFGTVGAMIYYFFFNEKGIDWRERKLLNLPRFGDFYRSYNASVFCRNLSMMWEGETNVTQRFRTVAETTNNPVYREMAEHITLRTQEGTPISEYFNGFYGLMGRDFASVIHTVNENPAQGPVQLYNYAKALEEKANEQLDVTIALLEQFSILIPVGFVVFILLASYLPLIEAVGRISKN